MVNPSPVAPAPPSSFSQNPFGKLSATDFQTNADAVAREKQDRLKEIQAAYDTQNRLRQVQDDQYSAAGSARGKQMFFDPRVKAPASSIGNRNITPPGPLLVGSRMPDGSTIGQAPVVRQAPVATPARPTVRSAADTRGPVAMTAPTGAPPPSLNEAIADLKGGNQFAAVNKMRQIVGLPTFDNMQEYLASQAAEKAAVNKRTGGIANLTQSRYYPRKTGQISGPGTETSDSIPAMLSDGEFVMTAKAVKSLGKGDRRAGAKKMYALMHQLERNASRG